MLKFIKMKYHNAYLLYYSVLFVVIVVVTVIEAFCELKSEMKKSWEQLRYAPFYVWNFWSAPVKTKTRK